MDLNKIKMKKAILIIILILCFVSADAQNHKRKERNPDKIGLYITGAGCAFTFSGFLTSPNTTWISTPQPGNSQLGYSKNVDFMHDGSRSLCIVSGITLTVSGLITMLATK